MNSLCPILTKSALRLLLLAIAVLVLAGCKMATPFRGPAADAAGSGAGEIAVVALTHVTLGDDQARNGVFWTHTFRVVDAVSGQPGYLGHSVRRELWGKEAWTMTVWNDEASMRDFVRSDIHQAANRAVMSGVAGARFAHVTLDRSQIPLSWETAERVLCEQGRGN
jgi:heme-degrading monooxygenase HmoA